MNQPIQPTLLVLAAGMGSRYGGLKQLDSFGPSGETLLEYSVHDAIRAGFGKIVFVIRKSLEADFTDRFRKRIAQRIPVEYVFQELEYLPPGFSVPPDRIKPWGTAQAVGLAGSVIREPFAVINGDDFYGAESFRILADFLRNVSLTGNEYALVGYQLRNTLSEFGAVARGICTVDAEGYLQNVVERTSIIRTEHGIVYQDGEGKEVPVSGMETVSMNMMGFTPGIFAHGQHYFEQFLRKHGSELKSEFYLPSLVNQLIQDNKARVRVLPSPEKWFGVTYQDDKPMVIDQLAQLVNAGVYPRRLWA